jgi:G3E family GTPase
MMEARPPWPIALVTGYLGSGKTTLITRLLRHPDMTDTMVIVNEFGEVGLDHHLIKAVTDSVILLPNGCLCCMIRQDVVQTLRELHRAWLLGSIPDFGRILIETTGLAEPAPLVASITSHPLLSDAFALQSITTLVDAEYGLSQIDGPTCRNQIRVADFLVVAKCDLAMPGDVSGLQDRLIAMNPLAGIWQSDGVIEPGHLFRRTATQPPRALMSCDSGSDHLAGMTTLLLRPQRLLAWTAFKILTHEILTEFGPRLLRLKGRLSFDAHKTPVIIQAVHHTFYPIVEAPRDSSDDGGDFLLLIFDDAVPAGIADRFARTGLTIVLPSLAQGVA